MLAYLRLVALDLRVLLADLVVLSLQTHVLPLHLKVVFTFYCNRHEILHARLMQIPTFLDSFCICCVSTCICWHCSMFFFFILRISVVCATSSLEMLLAAGTNEKPKSRPKKVLCCRFMASLCTAVGLGGLRFVQSGQYVLVEVLHGHAADVAQFL